MKVAIVSLVATICLGLNGVTETDVRDFAKNKLGFELGASIDGRTDLVEIDNCNGFIRYGVSNGRLYRGFSVKEVTVVENGDHLAKLTAVFSDGNSIDFESVREDLCSDLGLKWGDKVRIGGLLIYFESRQDGAGKSVCLEIHDDAIIQKAEKEGRDFDDGVFRANAERLMILVLIAGGVLLFIVRPVYNRLAEMAKVEQCSVLELINRRSDRMVDRARESAQSREIEAERMIIEKEKEHEAARMKGEEVGKEIQHHKYADETQHCPEINHDGDMEGGKVVQRELEEAKGEKAFLEVLRLVNERKIDRLSLIEALQGPGEGAVPVFVFYFVFLGILLPVVLGFIVQSVLKSAAENVSFFEMVKFIRMSTFWSGTYNFVLTAGLGWIAMSTIQRRKVLAFVAVVLGIAVVRIIDFVVLQSQGF